MARTSSKNMNGFYRKKKKNNGGITKKTSNRKTPKNAATSSTASPDFKDDYDEESVVLRQFDMNMAYGPCLGMSRLARWERANRLGLNPPKGIEVLLKAGKVQAGCLWDDRM